MLHDYWMYQDDPAFVSGMLPAVQSVLAWFAAQQNAKGSLKSMPWWNYVDWVRAWRNGVPPGTTEGSSSIQDLLLFAAYQWAADMESTLGSKTLADEYVIRARAIADAARSLYWDDKRGLFADTPAKTTFSQHQNAIAVVTGLLRGDEARGVAGKLIEDKSITESTLYFRYYLHSALLEAGLGDRFMDQLGTWRDALKVGLTTWPEMPEPSRSDAHAWSSHISIDFFRTMLGIRPLAPGFAKVRIEPYLGRLNDLSGVMPHPRGEISVSLKKTGPGMAARIQLPAGVTGEFVHRGVTKALHSGNNDIAAP